MAENQLKVFTVEEANRLIPHLSEMILDLQQKRDAILAMEVEIDSLELIADKDEHENPVGMSVKIEEYNRTVARFYALIDEVHATGCFLKDVDLGLIDFYTLHQGRVIYLCWKLGEAQIGYWHEVGRGYTYRQPLVSDSNKHSSDDHHPKS